VTTWGTFHEGINIDRQRPIITIRGGDEFCTERRNNPSPSDERGKDMFLATLRMAIPLQKRGEALRILKSTVARTQVQPDCVFCRICEDALEDNILQFEEMWKSQEELEHHLRSDEYQKVLLVLEMALKQPEIRFYTISSSTGIDTIEKARSRTN
jgi:quinol monooxygenase YgiN